MEPAAERGESITSTQQEKETSPAHVALDAARARAALDWYVRCSFVLAFTAIVIEVLRKDLHSRPQWPMYGTGALLVACCLRVTGKLVVAHGGFKPRYSYFVAEQVQTPLDKAPGAGVVLIEARVASGDPEGSFLRPPLVLEDASGTRLRLPMLQALDESGRPVALLGDQTNGILYRAGESVVFVGVIAEVEASPTYRDTGAEDLVARLDWLAFKGGNREEVVKALRACEPSMAPIVVVWGLLILNMVLVVGALVDGFRLP